LLGLSPAFRHRPVKFVYARREVILGLGLFALIVAIATGLYLGVYIGPMAPRVPAPQPFEPLPLNYPLDRLAQQVGMLLVIAFPFLVALRIRRQPLLSIGLSRVTMRAGLEMGLALAVIAIFLSNRIYAIINGMTPSKGIYLLAMLVVALADEFIFRGYLMLRLQGLWGDTWGWVAQALLFSLWHLPQKLILEHVVDPASLAISLAYMFAFGLLLGWIMRKSGNILAPALYHAIHNWVLILM
jgi:membrane protease YdiL (CAAX protease family)